MRKYILLCFVLCMALGAKAQFNIETNSGTVQQNVSNVGFRQTAGSWTVAGEDLGNVKKISRSAKTAETVVELTNPVSGVYFGDFWKNGVADYYVVLTNDEVFNSTADLMPVHPGGYMLYLDMWADVSADHKNAILPDGTYNLAQARGKGDLNTEFTLVRWNTLRTANDLKYFDRAF